MSQFLKTTFPSLPLNKFTICGTIFAFTSPYFINYSVLSVFGTGIYKYWMDGKVTLTQAWQITNGFQIAAYATGKVPFEKALEFTNMYQVSAVAHCRSTPEEALKIYTHAELNRILKIEKIANIMKNHNATIEQAKLFENNYQYWALEAGATIQEALEFTNEYQFFALDSGNFTIKEAIGITTYEQLETARNKMTAVEPLSSFNAEESHNDSAVGAPEIMGNIADTETLAA